MSFQTEHKNKINNLTYQLNNTDELRRSSNGGNTILFTFPPKEEQEYIELLKNHFANNAEFIDIGSLFVSFIDSFENMDEFEEVYKSINPSSKIFKSESDPTEDLFDMIINAIKQASVNQKIPILIKTGSLSGTGIENQNIMEHKFIMNELKEPLIILYPSILKENELYFLGIRVANKYRCTLVE